jgi:hypothetical protein
MNKMLRAAALIAILTLVLASCDILFMGTFPADTAQATARVDLSSSISAANASSFHLNIVKAGKYEFVILVSDTNFDSTLPHLLIMSPALAVQNSYSMDALVACNPNGVSFNGTGAVSHLADGHIVIGNLQTIVSSTGLGLDQKLNTAFVNLNGWTIEGPDPTFLTWSQFSLNGHLMSYQEYASDWSTVTGKSAAVSSGSTYYYLEGVFTDPEDATNNSAVLVFREQSNSNSSTFHFITVVKDSELFNQFPGGPIMENAAFTGSQIVKDNFKSGSVSITTDGIVAYNEKSRSLVFFTPSDPTNEKPLHVGGTPNGLQWAFSFSGSFYCAWDPATRILTRYEKWW